MPLTRDFRETVFERAQNDKKFRHELLVSAINEMLSGDLDTGKAILRDYINAAISFGTLAKELHKSDKSLQRMLSPTGNPTSKSLFAMLQAIQKIEGIHLQITIKNH